MSTLRPEEIEALMQICYVPIGKLSHYDYHAFAAAVEAELRKRWFAKPVAAIGAGWLLMYAAHEPLSTIVERHGLKIDDALYAAPQEKS